MNISNIYILISILILIIIVILVFFVGTKKNELTTLAGLSFSSTIAGIIFGDDRLIGYSLLGVGVILAIIDIFKRGKKKIK